MTAVAPCPYLPGMTERKVFANLPFSNGAHVNDELTHAGFRRSQNIAYRPACEGCDACVSVRLPAEDVRLSRTQNRIMARNADLSRDLVEAEVRTHLIEYRLPSQDGGPGDLVAVTLTDLLSDGLSMVYSFFDPDRERRSLGVFAILDHVRQARAVRLPYVYLGYWVEGSPKMDYKAQFRPMEALRPLGWTRLD